MKEFQRVDKKAKIKWRVSRSIVLLVLLIIAAIVYIGNMDAEGRVSPAVIIPIAAVLILQIVNIVVYPIIEYIQWSYLVESDRIEIKKGIFWRSHTVIPITRIQHVCAKSAPLQNLFGLASVEIHTAGGQHSIDELSKAVAEEMCDSLKTVINVKVEEQRALQQKKAAAQEEEKGVTFVD